MSWLCQIASIPKKIKTLLFNKSKGRAWTFAANTNALTQKATDLGNQRCGCLLSVSWHCPCKCSLGLKTRDLSCSLSTNAVPPSLGNWGHYPLPNPETLPHSWWAMSEKKGTRGKWRIVGVFLRFLSLESSSLVFKVKRQTKWANHSALLPAHKRTRLVHFWRER